MSSCQTSPDRAERLYQYPVLHEMAEIPLAQTHCSPLGFPQVRFRLLVQVCDYITNLCSRRPAWLCEFQVDRAAGYQYMALKPRRIRHLVARVGDDESAAESETVVAAAAVVVVAERAAQEAGGLGGDSGGAGRERVDCGGAEGPPGLHEIAVQWGHVGQAPHARENGPGAPLACLDGASQGVRPGAEGVGAGRGGHELAQLAARPGRGGQSVAAGLGLETAEGRAVKLAEVGWAAFEGKRSLLEAAAVERLGQAV